MTLRLLRTPDGQYSLYVIRDHRTTRIRLHTGDEKTAKGKARAIMNVGQKRWWQQDDGSFRMEIK